MAPLVVPRGETDRAVDYAVVFVAFLLSLALIVGIFAAILLIVGR